MRLIAIIALCLCSLLCSSEPIFPNSLFSEHEGPDAPTPPSPVYVPPDASTSPPDPWLDDPLHLTSQTHESLLLWRFAQSGDVYHAQKILFVLRAATFESALLNQFGMAFAYWKIGDQEGFLRLMKGIDHFLGIHLPSQKPPSSAQK